MNALDDLYDRACRTPSDIAELLPVLRRLASEVRRVTEFGVRGGNSTVALLAARPRVYRGYDLVGHENHAGLLRTATEAGVDARIVYADTSSLESIEDTDLLFVDTRHTADQVRAELAHLPSVSTYVAFHDTVTFGETGEDGGPGILHAIREVLAPDPGWTLVEGHTHSNGLQVWRRNKGGV